MTSQDELESGTEAAPTPNADDEPESETSVDASVVEAPALAPLEAEMLAPDEPESEPELEPEPEAQERREQHRGATVLQCRVRVTKPKIEVQELREQNQGAIVLQSATRQRQMKQEFQRQRVMRNAATVLQCRVRLTKAKIQVQELREQNQGAIVLQSATRQRQTKQEFQRQRVMRNAAALKLQGCARVREANAQVCKRRRRANGAAGVRRLLYARAARTAIAQWRRVAAAEAARTPLRAALAEAEAASASERNRADALEAELAALRAASAPGNDPARGTAPTETTSARAIQPVNRALDFDVSPESRFARHSNATADDAPTPGGEANYRASEGAHLRAPMTELTRAEDDEVVQNRELQEQRRLLEEIHDRQETQMQAVAEAQSEAMEAKKKMQEMSDRVKGLEVGNLYGGRVPSNTSAASANARDQGAIRAMLVVSGLQRIRPRSASPSRTTQRRSPPPRNTRSITELRQQEADRLGRDARPSTAKPRV